MNTHIYNKILTSLFVMFIVTVLTACGGGGSGGDSGGTGNEAPVAAVNTAMPGQLISVSHSSIGEDDIVDVTFETDGAQVPTAVNEETPVVVIKGIAHADGVVDVAAPTFFDINGLPVARDVRVLINGIPSTSLLHIEALPEMPVATGGAVLEGFLSVAIDYYSDALDNIDTIATQLGGEVDPADVQAAIEAQIQDLDNQLFELEVLGTHTVVIDGVSTVLTTQELDVLDHWLLYSLVSIDVATDVATGNAVVAADTQPNAAEVLRNAWNSAVAALEQEQINSGGVGEGTRDFVIKGVPEVLNKAEEASRTYTTYIFGFLSLVTAGAGALGDKALGVAAAAQNMAAAQYSSFTSMVNGYLSNQNTDSFLGDDKDGFSFGQELLSQAVRLGTAYLGGLQNKLGKISGNINTGLSVKDMLTEAQIGLCDVLNSLASICTGDTSQASGFTIRVYVNFDGTIKNFSGDPIDPLEADIKLSGSAAHPSISWPGGNAIGLVVVDATNIVQVYGIASEQDDNGDLVPFGSPVTYGDYSIPGTSVEGEFPAPALQPGILYEIFVQRNDVTLSSATLLVEVN